MHLLQLGLRQPDPVRYNVPSVSNSSKSSFGSSEYSSPVSSMAEVVLLGHGQRCVADHTSC
eukprot:scaffold1770_cov375-Prasinococcus_capsulatus_cf.AAC.22